MKKKTKNKNKKGFTLVELLAVIIILAIVVGITIPAVLTTTNNAKKKAFETAAQTVADWVDRQYQVYLSGLDGTDIATLDESFKNMCVRRCYSSSSSTQSSYDCSSSKYNNKNDWISTSYDGTEVCNCNCDNRLVIISSEFIQAAGLNPSNILFSTYGYNSYRIRQTDGKLITTNKNPIDSNIFTMDATAQKYTKVYINPETGRSCVTLQASSDGDYNYKGGSNKPVVCGGQCQSTDATKPDFCKAQ